MIFSHFMTVVVIILTFGHPVPQSSSPPKFLILLPQPRHLLPQHLILSHHLSCRRLNLSTSSHAILFIAADLGFELEDVLFPSGAGAPLVVSDSRRAILRGRGGGRRVGGGSGG